MDHILEMKGISKTFPGVKALDKVDFVVRKGEVHALIGENGAGKSTLMKVLTGIYTADEGSITYKGTPLIVRNTRDAQRQGISIIHQEFNLLPDLTVAENVFVMREPRKFKNIIVDDKKMISLTNELMENLGINIEATELVENLSVAKKQMVEIAKALAFKSDVLILDEPTSALAENEVDTLFQIIAKLRNENVAIVYISHRLEEFERIVDRVTVLRDGTFVGTKEWKNTSIPEVVCDMVGRTLDEQYPQRDWKSGDIVFEAKGIKRNKVLKNVSLSVRDGEVLGISGLMGAGRTEFARAIFGADAIDEGKFYLHGEEVKMNSTTDAIECGIAYLPEDRKVDGLFLDLEIDTNVVIANLKEYSKFGIVDDKLCGEVVKDKIAKLKIKTPSAKQIAQYLSGGNQQKVLISRWLCKDSKVVIFDEPTRGIDVGAKYEVYTLINEIAKNGTAVIMISSEMPEILGMSDRILVMCEGKVMGELSKEEATQERILHMASGLHIERRA